MLFLHNPCGGEDGSLNLPSLCGGSEWLFARDLQREYPSLVCLLRSSLISHLSPPVSALGTMYRDEFMGCHFFYKSSLVQQVLELLTCSVGIVWQFSGRSFYDGQSSLWKISVPSSQTLPDTKGIAIQSSAYEQSESNSSLLYQESVLPEHEVGHTVLVNPHLLFYERGGRRADSEGESPTRPSEKCPAHLTRCRLNFPAHVSSRITAVPVALAVWSCFPSTLFIFTTASSIKESNTRSAF